MNLKKINFENSEILQIYINKIEEKNSEIIEKFNEIKKEDKNISIFIAGKNETTQTIKEMLDYQKSKDIK